MGNLLKRRKAFELGRIKNQKREVVRRSWQRHGLIELRGHLLLPLKYREKKKKKKMFLFFSQVSASLNLLFLFFYLSSVGLGRFLHSCFSFRNTTISTRSTNDEFEEDEIEEEAEEDQLRYCSEEGNLGFFSSESSEKEDLVADIILGGEALVFLPSRSSRNNPLLVVHETDDHPEKRVVDEIATVNHVSPSEYASASTNVYATDDKEEEEEEEAAHDENIGLENVVETNVQKAGEHIETENDETSDEIEAREKLEMEDGVIQVPMQPYHEILLSKETHSKDDNHNKAIEEGKNSSQDESFLGFTPPTEPENCQPHEEGAEVLASSFTLGSTSHSSYEWRSSTNYRGSETDDPFTSSSRRSSSKWEHLTVYKKYDEEMMFFDRISAQKLSETDSFRSIQVQPRSISQRIMHGLTSKRREPEYPRNAFQELEAAYVAQICLTWEALNWNYTNFQRLKGCKGDEDTGCPAHIAQQFQRFQVLLQRFIEMEPYERGRRPEIYARVRISSPKLLQVPEFQDSEGDRSKEDKDTRIASAEFLIVLEDAIRTFMNFLKADKKRYCEFLRAFRRKKQRAVDPTLLYLIKKANEKKKMKLKDIRRGRKCLRKRRLKAEEEMETLMGLIDLKIVSRVLRMSDLTEEQLHWCEEKMSKVRIWEGKLHRDSTPLFFPSH
ncbi:hypothetical protein ACLOJK_032977 [Asimina triloba]